MATIPIQQPRIAPGYLPFEQPDVGSLPVTSSDTVYDGDVLILASGAVHTAATNPASALIGLALHASGAVYAPVGTPTKYATPFGTYTNTGTALVPGEPTNMHFAYFHNGMRFEFSLDPAVTLTQSLVGSSAFGLVTAGAGDIWYVTNASSPNAVCTVVGIVLGPEGAAPGAAQPVLGTDTGGRLIVEFIPSTLAL